MEIEVFSSKINKNSVRKAAILILSKEKVSCHKIVVHFVGKKKIASLHQEFFSDPAPTDCITFPIDPIGKSCDILGEIFICLEVAREYAAKHHIPLQEELTLYLVHGLLHLLGYEDHTSQERAKMRKKEKRCMHFLKKNDAFIKLLAL